MPSGEDPKSSKKKNEEEDAVSVESNPPYDEALEGSQQSTPPAEKAAFPPGGSERPVPLEGREPYELRSGDMVGAYLIDKKVGQGGMATVYRAFDVSKQRVVALKTLRRKFSSSSKALARFDREFLALESLDHPNIVRVLDKGVEAGTNYFVMEYVDGASLSRLLRYRKLTLNTKAQILLQAAAALEYAHRRGIVHRDVKPDNVLIDRTGRAKIADFGIAQITKADLPLTSLTVVSSFMGTADYMAPEQRVDAKSVDHRADIFSFGVMLYETFTGRLPIGNFSLPSQLNPELSKRMDGIILRALRQNPAERYQGMAELAADLEREIRLSALGRLKARLSLILQTESWKKLFSARTIGAFSVLAIIVAGLVWLYSASSRPSAPPSQPEVPETDTRRSTPPTVTPPVPGSLPPQPPGTPKNMIYIPAGEFTMGSNTEMSNERPKRRVYLDRYHIDIYEVTNEEYKRFVDATGHPAPYVNAFWAEPFNWHNRTYPPGKGDHPVVLVNWYDATAYAKWANARLPSEAEWENAARGPEGAIWPWGNNWDSARCNTKESSLNSTQPVYFFPDGRSPFGCYNMAGNVMEWTADWYAEDYYRRAPSRNPTGPLTGLFKVARGGGWDSSISLYARAGYRHYFPPDTKSAGIGFRCVKDAEEE
jgi:serine/threonine-protein kinase